LVDTTQLLINRAKSGDPFIDVKQSPCMVNWRFP